MFKLRVLPYNVLLLVEEGKNLLEVLINNDIKIETVCGGKGWCGKCKVRIIKGKVTELTDSEIRMLNNWEIENNVRLACQIFLKGDLEVEILNRKEEMKIIKDFYSKNKEIKENSLLFLRKFEISPPSLRDQKSDLERLISFDKNLSINNLMLLRQLPHILRKIDFKGNLVIFNNEIIDIKEENNCRMYGVAFDIGTTTIVGYLLDLNNFREIDVISKVNPQSIYGSDIISRITFIMENSNGLDILHKILIKSLEEIIIEFSKRNNVSLDDIYIISVAGNPVMTHIFLGISPEYISFSPFVPVFRKSMIFSANELLNVLIKAKVYTFPLVSGYIGGDIVAGIIATNLLEEKGNILFMDIGTNGEIVLKIEEKLYACATAAGPAFEGGNISCGMIASKGAIDHVWLEDKKISYSVIGGIEEIGITGSGFLDSICVMLDLGILDLTGKFKEGEEFYIGKVRITQKDIREFQLAKSAIRAGIEILIKRAGLSYDQIDKVYIAGAFGSYIDKDNALRINLIPSVRKEKIFLVGNASGMGAKLVLMNKDLIKKADEISEKIEYIELSSLPEFNEYFIKFMYF